MMSAPSFPECLAWNEAGGHRHGEAACGFARAYAERCVLHHDAFLGRGPGDRRSFQVWFRIRLAVGHIVGCDSSSRRKYPGIGTVDVVQQTGLRRTGHQYPDKSQFSERAEHSVGTFDERCWAIAAEPFRLDGVEPFRLFVADSVAERAPEQQVDRRFSGHPLEEIKPVAVSVDAYVTHHAVPRERMVAHRVIERSVHVDKRRAKPHLLLRCESVTCGETAQRACYVIFLSHYLLLYSMLFVI